MKEKIIIIIIVVAILGLISYGYYSSKSSEQLQVLKQQFQQQSDLEDRINDLDEKIRKSAELSTEHLKLSQNLQKQVNMLEFTQVRQNIDINILSNYCTPVAINSISENIDRLRESGVYSTDSLSSLENLFNYYIQGCK